MAERNRMLVLGESQVIDQLISDRRTADFPELIVAIPELSEKAERLALGLGSTLYRSRFFDHLKKIPKDQRLKVFGGLVRGIDSRKINGPISTAWVIVADDQVESLKDILGLKKPEELAAAS